MVRMLSSSLVFGELRKFSSAVMEMMNSLDADLDIVFQVWANAWLQGTWTRSKRQMNADLQTFKTQLKETRQEIKNDIQSTETKLHQRL